jgi:L-ribulose-5-phosphate 4-epimerase
MSDKRLRKLKEKVFKSNIELVQRNLVIFTFGNASGIDRESGIFAIKPSGFEYKDLTPDDMVLIDLNGNIVESNLNPSSDKRTHLQLYKNFSDIGGIVHTHSRFATAWAQSKKSIQCLGTTHADYFFGEIPCTEIIRDEQIAEDYEKETGNLIIETFKNKDIDYHHMKACLVASHGPFTWGKDSNEAVFISEILEEIAQINLYSAAINPQIENIKKSLLDKHYLRKHGKYAYYGQKKNSRKP